VSKQQGKATEPAMPPKPKPWQPPTGELASQRVDLEPPPPKEKTDNELSKMTLAFLEAGAPLQDGLPDDANKLLTKLRKAQA
jgi:hypothetical protein